MDKQQLSDLAWIGAHVGYVLNFIFRGRRHTPAGDSFVIDFALFVDD